jgi:NADPH:quinone reductase-like Zn-dependent oxidoreductase
MRAVVIHQYGGHEVLKFEEYPAPVPEAGEVLVRVAATSINPFDIMRRSGNAKDVAPSQVPWHRWSRPVRNGSGSWARS